jgi:hypothetical protein
MTMNGRTNAYWLGMATALIAVSAIVLAQENPIPRDNVREESGLVATHVAPVPERESSAAHEPPPQIQIALLLDTSNSMDGLIGQAKTQLWKVVNEFIPARRDGRRPELRVALFEYGNNRLPASEGHIRLVTPLTDDLDKVSEELFALTTDGGNEYCGQVIQVAANCLDWSSSSDDLKLIFIAGNEPFTQGQVDYRTACRAAISKGIVINTIFCGRQAEGERTNWKDGAVLADGEYVSIEQNRTVAHIAAPQDDEIARLGVEINNTYVPYGEHGAAGQARQTAQDDNVASTGAGNMVQRAVTKGSANYSNQAWDLVDAVKDGAVKLEDVKPEALPEEMQSMSLGQRQSHVAEKTRQRAELQKQIQTLNEQRKQFVAAKMKELAEESGHDTLDSAVIKICRKQAAERHFEFE